MKQSPMMSHDHGKDGPGNHNRGGVNEGLNLMGIEEGDGPKTHENREAGVPSSEPEASNGRVHDVIDTDHTILPSCGVGSWHPRFLQRFKTMGYFAGIYGFAGIMTSALAVYIGSQITALEKHFNLNSSLSGMLMSSNEIGFFITCLPFSYLARRVHIPRALGVCAIIYGVSGLMCVIPYFGTKENFSIERLSVTNQTNAKQAPPGQMCTGSDHVTNISMTTDNVTSDDPSTPGSDDHQLVSDQWRTLAIILIGVGMSLQGAAKAPRSSYSMLYVDDNVPKTKTALYLGFIMGLGVLGPALAFVVGGALSSIYITLEDTHLNSRDPRWLGAWWLGFLLFGSLSLIAGIPLLCFPRRMAVKPGIAKAEQKRQDRLSTGKNVLVAEITAFLRTIAKLFINPLYVMMVVAGCISSMAYAGAFAFLPKFAEVYFNQPSWRVNYLVGGLNVGPAAIGMLISGVLTARFKMSPFACLKTAIGLQAVSVACQAACFLFSCQQTRLIPDFGRGVGNGSSLPCINGCQCKMDATTYFPVCGDDGFNYFSPCHAGCTDTTDDRSIFTNCSCMASPEYSRASGGLCGGGCDDEFYLYMFLSFLSIFCLSLSIMPMVIITLRAVSEAQKPLALGVGPFLASLLGSFPSPMVYGAVIDSTCLITYSDVKGACKLYDLDAFRMKFLATYVSLRGVIVVLLVCAYVYVRTSKKPVFHEHNDDEELNVKKPVDHEHNGSEEARVTRM